MGVMPTTVLEASHEKDHWPLVPLGDIGTVYGGLVGKSKQSFGRGSARYVTFMNVITAVRVDTDLLGYVDVASGEEQNRVMRGDLFFNGSSETPGEIGLCACLTEGVSRVFLNSFCIGYRLGRDSGVEAVYVAYLFRSRVGRELLWSLAQGATRYNLSKSALLRVSIPLPCIDEQRAIINALSDADALIDALGNLLAKKRQIKQGAMQELLTGRKRLPGFQREWQARRLVDLGATYGGLTGKVSRDFGHGAARFISFMGVMSSVVLDANLFEAVDVQPGEAQNRAFRGDLFFNGSSETPEEVGMCSLLDQDVPNLFLNSFCFGFRLKPDARIDRLFFAYYFRSGQGRELVNSLAQGATRYNLSKKALLQTSFPMPELPEHSAIALTLSDMDAEIEALQTKLSKARQLKQGMMQALLTGAIRLPVEMPA